MTFPTDIPESTSSPPASRRRRSKKRSGKIRQRASAWFGRESKWIAFYIGGLGTVAFLTWYLISAGE